MRKYLLIFLVFLNVHFSDAAKQVKTIDNRSFLISKNLNIYNSLFRELDLNYVDTLSYDKMVKLSIDNMLEKLDPYTVYMPEEETDDLKFMTTGEYAGIGALIVKNGADVCISEPYEGMPAQRNDVRAGDVILEIDGVNVVGKSVNDVSVRLKGTPNTIIKLKLKRPGEKKPIERSFKREKIQMNPVSYAAPVSDGVGYVLLGEFTDRAAVEVKSSVETLIKNNGIKSLVLDLRNNGGGLVDEAVKILGYFLPKGTEVVKTRGKAEDATRSYKTPTEPIFPDLKLVILVNRSSASASEILAGSLQDLDRAVLVGERTYGKGLVQNIRSVGYGGHLKVTTAKYYIPSGRCIQAIDYSHRNDDGSVGRVPDSLTHEFRTKNGRKVRDGGGILPDSITKDDKTINVAYYIYMQNLYFDFVSDYVLKHQQVSVPADFELSDADFKSFEEYLIKRNFNYKTQTEKAFEEFLEVAKYEGVDKTAKKELDALRDKLKPGISRELELYKKDVVNMLSLEIMKRYYFQKGVIQYSLRSDDDLKVALKILKTNGLSEGILGR